MPHRFSTAVAPDPALSSGLFLTEVLIAAGPKAVQPVFRLPPSPPLLASASLRLSPLLTWLFGAASPSQAEPRWEVKSADCPPPSSRGINRRSDSSVAAPWFCVPGVVSRTVSRSCPLDAASYEITSVNSRRGRGGA